MATPTRSTRSSRCISLIIPKNFLAPTINSENCFMDCMRDFTTREVKPENEALAQKAGLMGPR
uniref:Uncharacterized protein n=1 Tax=Oncorhynchus tshawytscha TaxID=74940 RepID=A0A8C8C274_ONCTS